MIVTPAGSTPDQSTQDTLMSAGVEAEAKQQKLLAKVMKDCGSFISIWATSRRYMNHHRILASYKTVAKWIVTDTWDPASHPDIERLLPLFAFNILSSTYRNDLRRLQHQLEHLPGDISADIIRTAMFIASAAGCIDVAETLFSRGVDIDSRDSKGQTCLHIAAIHNHISMVSFLINHNADVNKRRNDSQTVWSSVCTLASHENISHLLIESGADKHVLIDDGVSPLYVAAAGGHTRDVELLLRQGVNPSIKTVFDWEPLVSDLQDIFESSHGGILTTGVMQHWAASNGFLEVVKLLVEAGANVNCVTDTGATPLGLVGNRSPDIREYLENHGARATPGINENLDDHGARAILLELVKTIWPDINEYLEGHSAPATLLKLMRKRLPKMNEYLKDHGAPATLLELIRKRLPDINKYLEDHRSQATLLEFIKSIWLDINELLEDDNAPAILLELVRPRWPDITEHLENHIARATLPPPQTRARQSRSSEELVRAGD